MGKQEHRVSVDNGKYTFIVPADDYRVSILRYGDPWHGPQSEASNALHAAMAELDAARVIVQAVRDAEKWPCDPRMHARLMDALALHDRLCDDREPPSAWCGAECAERAAAEERRVAESRATYRSKP